MTPSRRTPWQKGFWLVLLISGLLWSFSGLGLDPARLWRGLPQLGQTLWLVFAHPDWSYAPDVFSGLIESVQIAVIGTVIGAILALPFGAIAARNVCPLKVASGTSQFGLNAIRTVPELVLALVFIKALGPGSFAGALAVGFHSIGTMGKLYAERMESTEAGALDALRAAGASRWQVFRHAICPDIAPDVLSLSLYRLDINVRASTILGIVGAGGVGTLLQFQIGKDWPKVGMVLIGIMLTVGCIDTFSSVLRKQLQ